MVNHLLLHKVASIMPQHELKVNPHTSIVDANK
jgi:hypothetical protein